MGYSTPAGISVAMDAMANSHPDSCTRLDLGSTEGGRPLAALEIHDAEAATRLPIVVTGGVHAREWAPPDALLDFAQRLLAARANTSDIVYDSMDVDGVTYCDPNYVIPSAAVNDIFNRFSLVIMPLVNPDGREFSMRGQTGSPTTDEQMWRKNRSSSGSTPPCVGVDINRNFDIAWDQREYYRPDAALLTAISEDACDTQLYKGPKAFSENETCAVRDLVLQKRPTVFVDVHMHGRTIQYPWGMDRNQVLKPLQNFANVDEHHLPAVPSSGRDGLLGDSYGEFVPSDHLDRVKEMANVMAAEILTSAGTSADAQQRSTYTTGQTVDFPVVPKETFVGCSDDWVFSRQFSDPSFGEVFAFTIEVGKRRRFSGDENDGGFFPRFTGQFPKVAREIHAALFGLLTNGGL